MLWNCFAKVCCQVATRDMKGLRLWIVYYDVHSELFFNLDEGGRRGHEKKLFKKDLD